MVEIIIVSFALEKNHKHINSNQYIILFTFIHADGGDHNLSCPSCRTVFHGNPQQQKGNFRRHWNGLHIKLQTFACRICGKSFNRKHNMVRHEARCTFWGVTFPRDDSNIRRNSFEVNALMRKSAPRGEVVSQKWTGEGVLEQERTSKWILEQTRTFTNSKFLRFCSIDRLIKFCRCWISDYRGMPYFKQQDTFFNALSKMVLFISYFSNNYWGNR